MKNIYQLIKLNRMFQNHRVKIMGVLLAHLLGLRHLFIRMDPVMACNLKCTMCHFSDPEYRAKHRGVFKEEQVDNLARQFFPLAIQLVIGCGAEPTLYRDFVEIIKIGKRYKIPNICLVTNGQLLSKEHINQIIDNRLDELIISIHGVKRGTYEKFMPGASYAKLHELLHNLDVLKRKYESSKPELRINYTVNPDNLFELSDFFNVFNEYNIKTLQVRPMVNLGNTVYTGTDLSKYRNEYNGIIQNLARIAHTKNVIFISTPFDSRGHDRNGSDVVLGAVYRYLSPEIVWKSDFDWENESYKEYCTRINWTSHLLHSIFSPLKKLETGTALQYDIT